MSTLSSCQRCHGFVPPELAECVHCGASMQEPAPRGGVMSKGLVVLASAGVAAITLMACYGMPPCNTPAPDGGSDPYHCYDQEPPVPDSGIQADGGDAGP
ncbi:hypothetical protein [Melittangium boletus]|uniref:Uncharacterized protein n=1 Tax=Melittangium boletus DSM 14713 TaxID=1294270 RepID=A0A250IF81_9BACT|nr:hypothetical protein [Melittangium boletus]ATB29812.1 hypothetical protein MEBOL_003267 [Melittangium boletus DSM 14713]